MCYQVLFFVLYLFFPGVNNNNKYNTHKINTINGLIFTRFSEDFETFSKHVNYLNVSSDNTTPLKTRPGATVHLRPTLNTRLSVPENWLVLTELQVRSSTHFRRRPTTVEYSYVKKQRVFLIFFFFLVLSQQSPFALFPRYIQYKRPDLRRINYARPSHDERPQRKAYDGVSISPYEYFNAFDRFPADAVFNPRGFVCTLPNDARAYTVLAPTRNRNNAVYYYTVYKTEKS